MPRQRQRQPLQAVSASMLHIVAFAYGICLRRVRKFSSQTQRRARGL